MKLGRRQKIARIFGSLWLLYYVAAGLLVHAPLGHVHHSGSPHQHAAPATELAQSGHTHAEHEHDHADHSEHEHSHAEHQHEHSPAELLAESDATSPAHQHSDQPAHDDDCAGCQLLGSFSAPAPAIVLEVAGELTLPAPLPATSAYTAEISGTALARAPPALA